MKFIEELLEDLEWNWMYDKKFFVLQITMIALIAVAIISLCCLVISLIRMISSDTIVLNSVSARPSNNFIFYRILGIF